MAKEVFTGLGELILSALSFDGDGIKRAINKMSGAMSKFGAETAQAFRQAYDEEIARSEAEERAEEERKKKEKQGLANAELDSSLLQLLGGDGGIALQQDKPDQPQQGQGQPPRVKPPGATGITDGVTDSSTSRGGAKGGGKITHVTIQIGKLVESLTIKTANLATDPSEIKAIITETLLAAVNDANLAIQ